MTITPEELKRRVAEAQGLQTANKGGNGANAQGSAVYDYLKKHGAIASNNPLLAQLNPKYPTDAVWTNCAVRMRETLAADGFVVIASGRKPTIYRLVALPSMSATPATPAPKAEETKKQTATPSN